MNTSVNGPRTLFLDTPEVARLIHTVGLPASLKELVELLRQDYLRWPDFQKAARVAAYTPDGVIELMPITDGVRYSFKCVNGHPGNGRYGLPTVMAMGALLDCDTGMIRLLSELTLTTALRTAANSVLAARALARADSRSMALIGNGAQSDFQAIAFRALMGIKELRLYDVDRHASERLRRNLLASRDFMDPFQIRICDSAERAIEGADIVTTVTAHQGRAEVLSADMLAPGMHLNAVGGDSPGKTELDPGILTKAAVFVEYPPQTRREGEIQQMAPDFPVTELWQVLAGLVPGRTDRHQITLFDSVGFALEDYSALRFIQSAAIRYGAGIRVDVTPAQSDPRDLYGWWLAQGRHEPALQQA
ncbi:MAG: ornithine cyclodeaminase [Castellaniella sp.]|uniref:ornithine cyclodeaminase n=1 Tax=Castellaniella sp. TaxID=1955812 RepID=UPI00121C285A|nr:ornithine cyclodeaminase [Castellaniella sp.]TAN30582.1 MAG: ornithine cyclodeaminase [Castellaniella sp.]